MICNPYALFKAFLTRPDFQKYRHFWVISDLEELRRLRKKYADYENVRFVMYGSDGYAYCLAKAKYLINNVTFDPVFSKREGQRYLNTWHSITVKTLGFDVPDGARYVKNELKDFLMTDYLVSSNTFMTSIFDNSYKLKELYEGKYIEQGSPRNDLVTKTGRNDILDKLMESGTVVDRNKKIILYAPTYVGVSPSDVNPSCIEEYEALYGYLSEHIDMSQYELLIKPHNYVYRKLNEEKKAENRYVSVTIDTNELLSAVDILITDYSSIFFDYLLADRPILFYLSNYEKYQEIRGVYYKPEELPGPYTAELPQLAEYVNHIEQVREEYQERRNEMRAWACKYDDGEASLRVLNVFLDNDTFQCRLISAQKTGKKKLLFYLGALAGNGVTTAALNLLRSIDYGQYDVSVFVLSLKEEIANWNFDQIPRDVRVFLRSGAPRLTEKEKPVYDRTRTEGFLVEKEKLQKYLMRREYTRCFGDAKWDYIIDFAGFGQFFSCLTLLGAGDDSKAKYLIWQHNDMQMEFENERKSQLSKRKFGLEALRATHDRFDTIISCGKAVYEINKANFATEETAHKFTYCTNLINENHIRRGLEERPFLGLKDWLVVGKDAEQDPKGAADVTMIPRFQHAVKFVTVGRCMPEKNHGNLIRAAKKLIDEGEDVVLYIIGDGLLKGELIQLSRELGIADQVIFTGFLKNPFLLLKECDCFVLPSIYEGQGLVVLEARCVGLPIIVSNYGAVESVLLDDQQFILKGMDADSIYEGMKAYLNGEVPRGYTFDIAEYNRKAMREFEKLFEEKEEDVVEVTK